MEKPIKGIMENLKDSLENLVDANTVVGDPIVTSDGTTIIPISKITVGFASAGSDKDGTDKANTTGSLFSGGSGGGASVTPVAFLVVANGNTRVLPITNQITSIDRIIDSVPDVIDKVNGIVKQYKK